MRSIAIVNQKGGCGKTTTVVNLAGSLVSGGLRALVVDLDPQAHATLGLGVDPDLVEENLYDVLADHHRAADLQHIILSTEGGIDLAPSGIALSALEQKLAAEGAEARTERLARALALLPRSYDVALIDCPPNVGLLTFNALRAAQEVIIPLETSFFAIRGVEKLLETLGLLAERVGHGVRVRVLATLYDGRTRSARDTLAEIREQWKDLCFETVIRSNVKLREAARAGVPIVRIAPESAGARDYAALAVEVAGPLALREPGAADAFEAEAPGGEPADGRWPAVSEHEVPAAPLGAAPAGDPSER